MTEIMNAEHQVLVDELDLSNKRLMELEKAKSQFVSNVKNEINNPMASIKGLAELITSGKHSAEKMIEFARSICRDVQELEFNLENIFAAADLENGEGDPVFENVNISGLIDGVLKQFGEVIDEKELVVNKAYTQELYITTDAQKVQLIIVNLISNAVKFSPHGQELAISAQIVDDRLQLSVEDSGPGIDEKKRELIYDRFRQLDSGRTKQFPGLGLGLSITKALVDLLDGEIQIEQSNKDGCIWQLWIPGGTSSSEMMAQEGNVFLF